MPPKKLYTSEELLRHARLPALGTPAAPVLFQSNVGQADGKSPFILRSVNYAARFTPTSITAAVTRRTKNPEDLRPAADGGNAVVLSFKGANKAKLVGQNAVGGSVNWVVGRDRGRWLSKIPSFNALQYRDLYRGIQAVVRADAGRLEYGFLLDAGADPATIRISVGGITRLALDGGGNLVMETSGGPIIQTKPRFFDIRNGQQVELEGRFTLFGADEYGFAVEGHAPGAQLLIDPEIVFATYFGGSGDEGFLGGDDGGMDFIGRGFDIAIGPNGHLYVIGLTASADFPVDRGGPLTGSTDVFVMRVDPAREPGQQLVYATFIGGSSTERGRAVAPLADGRVYITGHSSSSDFPTSGGVVQQTRVGSGGYLARLADDGTFDIGTFIGRPMNHHPNSVVFNQRADDPGGFVYVAGSARTGTGAATPGSFQRTHLGGRFDGFLVKLDPELTRYEYFTYLGGANRDVVTDLDVNDGFAFVTGTTTSTNFPTTEVAMQPRHSQAVGSNVNCTGDDPPRQCFDAFVTRVNRDGSGLVYSTLFGAEREEYARGIAVTPQNRATITGAARSPDGGQTDIFVTRFEGGGENFIWDRRLSAQGTDHGEEVVVDNFGRTHFTGTVSADGLATGLSSETFHGGRSDIFYSRLTENGEVEYFTYLGGSSRDRGFAIAVAGESRENCCVALAGSTTSADIGTVNPLSGGEERRGRADLLLYTLCDIDADFGQSDFTKRATPSSVQMGEELSFFITVNNGGDTAAQVTITDDVPLEVTGVSGPGCTRTGNRVTCSFNAPPGATTITITANAGERCPNNVPNTANIQVGNQQFPASASVSVTCPPPLCPNGRLDPGEQCDDGNSNRGDGCRHDCTVERCGDRTIDPNEQCDDGNTNNNDRCSNACIIQVLDECTPGGPPCAGSLICGRRCSPVTECTLIIFCDTFLLCQYRPSCMPPGDATYIDGP